MNKIFTKISLLAAMILTLTGLMTAVMTYAGLPDGPRFVDAWLPVWLKAALIIAPLGFTLMYLLGKAISAGFPNMSGGTQKILLGASMGLVMESLMATVTTLQLHGWGAGFAGYWVGILIAALPVAVAMSLAMTFLIKPRLDKVLLA